MDWSKIKTIFIVTFLILDVYLLYQFMIIRNANKYEIIPETSLEDKLEADEIKYVEPPKMPILDQYVSAKSRIFKKDDLTKLKGQSAIIKDGTSLFSTFSKPIQMPVKFDQTTMSTFIKENVLYGDHYQFWEKNDNNIIYIEQYGNKPLFNNELGMLTFTLNKEDQIVAYKQTYLEVVEKLNKEEDVLPPLNAIETLYQNGKILPKSKVTRIELGYLTLIHLPDSQVLVPTWHIEVDEKEDLFVNALEGQIIDNSDENKVVE